MDAADGDPDPKTTGLTYFNDFIRLLDAKYPYASVESVLIDIDYVRSFAPARATLERREHGVYVLKSPIGFGHIAIIEMEFDVDGILQPVMGGIIRT